MAYEYVSRTKYTPVRIKLEKIISKIRTELKANYTFQDVLIGSGRKKLITQEVGSNKGFDFDYNLSLQKVKNDNKNAKTIREDFFKAFKKFEKEFNYKTEDSTYVITIKFIDHKNKKIRHSCDFAIVNDYEDNNGNSQQEIIIRDKKNNKPNYLWNQRPVGSNYVYKLRNIETGGIWNELRTEYLKLKNNNKDKNKKSFHLFYEAINNVYNRYDWQS